MIKRSTSKELARQILAEILGGSVILPIDVWPHLH